MALWLIRGGAHGEYEKQFFDDNRVYLTWYNLNTDLSTIKEVDELRELLSEYSPDSTKNKIINYSGQIWAFCKKISKGDRFVLPSKHK